MRIWKPGGKGGGGEFVFVPDPPNIQFYVNRIQKLEENQAWLSRAAAIAGWTCVLLFLLALWGWTR